MMMMRRRRDRPDLQLAVARRADVMGRLGARRTVRVLVRTDLGRIIASDRGLALAARGVHLHVAGRPELQLATAAGADAGGRPGAVVADGALEAADVDILRLGG